MRLENSQFCDIFLVLQNNFFDQSTMKTEDIHGFKVEYDDESDTVRYYLEHLKNRLSHEEMKAFITNAEHDSLGRTHLEDNYGNRVTLEYKGDGSCLIRKRLS
jgi:hypothetical protein